MGNYFKKSEETNEILKKKNAAEDALNALGNYSWAKQGEYDKLLSDYQNRKDFSYDVNADALYNQYKDKYIQQGKMAMADAIGQASAMTGGYGNSYAATVGNQAYQGQLQNLNDVVPELYQMAYDRYNQKGQDMLNAIGLMDNERSTDYALWADKYNRLVADRDYYDQGYKAAWDRDYKLSNKLLLGSAVKTEDTDLSEVEPTETQRTTDFIDMIGSKDDYLAKGHTESEWKEYIENTIANFVHDSRINDGEMLYLIQHYQLS